MASVEGLQQLLAKLTDLGTQGHRMASAIVNSVGDMVVAEAKANAPSDLGKIRQGIVKEQIDSLRVMIAATAPESVFQEFGTGGKVEVPAAMADVASSFQGQQGGSMAEFVLALTGWVERHGISGTKNETSTEIAWGMAFSILRTGLKPQPFLYPAFVVQSKKMLPMLETAFNELMKSKQS